MRSTFAGASTVASSSATPAFKYDVFLSFRGEDTRHNFTSHLYEALLRRKIETYRDDEKLERGDEISQALKRAIELSKLSVVIFSEKYASSSWCLDELVHILECREKFKQTVLPVFYRVDPSDVRQQKGTYEKRFTNKPDKVQKWRDALRAAANLAGWDSQVIRSESNLVEKIVQDILSKLSRTPSGGDFKGLVGTTRRAAQIESLLRIGSLDVLKVGIWGIGGIGKTTLARVVFNQLSSQFESGCFLENVREKWDKGQKDELKNRLFSLLLEEANPNMGTLSVGSTYNKFRLRSKKVLVVFDDVDDSQQLEFLAEDYEWFGPGSRIIITTRNMQVLRGEDNRIYEVERLNNEEALQLFHSNAFKTTPPTKDLLHLSERVISYAEGNPLALKILGSFLRGKRRGNWEEELDKLKECPNTTIQSVLRISYDGLDKKQKCIFLDIACFFKGMYRDNVERILEACGLFPKSGIDDLIDKCLIITKDDKLWMHDLVQGMGWEIVQSVEDLSGRSRLWNPRDVYDVLKFNIGTAATEAIALDMSNISEVHFSPAAFQNMCRLRLLKIFHSSILRKCQVCFPRGDHLQFLPDSLRYLHWDGYPWQSFPSSFRPHYLVELNLLYSNVKTLWEGRQCPGSLKKIDLSYSKDLTKLPDLSGASKLKHIYLDYCLSLQKVPSSFQHLHELETLTLEGCSSVHKFPMLPKSIICLVLSRTAITSVPLSIESLSCLETLNLNYCEKLKRLPCFSKVERRLKAIMLEGTSLGRRPSMLPQWIRDVAAHSDLSFYKHNEEEAILEEPARYGSIFLRPCSEQKYFAELPVFGSYEKDHLSVEIVSVFTKELRKQNPNFLCVLAGQHLFYNCLWLYDGECSSKTEKSIRKLQRLSRKIALREFAGGLPIKAEIGVCCPGNEIPEWFHGQSSRRTVQEMATFGIKEVVDFIIELPTNSLDNPNFLGFAVCVACDLNFPPPSPRFTHYLSLECTPSFILNNGNTLPWDLYCEEEFHYLEKRSTVLEKITKVVFRFSLFQENSSGERFCVGRVNECRIRLLCAEDVNKFNVPNCLDDWKLEEEEEVVEKLIWEPVPLIARHHSEEKSWGVYWEDTAESLYVPADSWNFPAGSSNVPAEIWTIPGKSWNWVKKRSKRPLNGSRKNGKSLTTMDQEER